MGSDNRIPLRSEHRRKRGRRQALQRSSGIRRRVENESLSPTILRDLYGRIAEWNRAAEKRYGFSREQAVGEVSHYLLRTVFPCPLSEINKLLLDRAVWEGELIHTVRDGARVKVVSRWELFRDQNGERRVREINEAFVRVDAEQAQLAVPTIASARYKFWNRPVNGNFQKLALFLLPIIAILLLAFIATHLPPPLAPIPPHF